MDGLSRFYEQDQRDEEYLERWLNDYVENEGRALRARVETIDTIPEPLGSEPGTMTGLRWYTLPGQAT